MVSSLECLQQLLKCTDSEFMLWLTLPLTNSHVSLFIVNVCINVYDEHELALKLDVDYCALLV